MDWWKFRPELVLLERTPTCIRLKNTVDGRDIMLDNSGNIIYMSKELYRRNNLTYHHKTMEFESRTTPSGKPLCIPSGTIDLVNVPINNRIDNIPRAWGPTNYATSFIKGQRVLNRSTYIDLSTPRAKM
jgi:hypothetical protein